MTTDSFPKVRTVTLGEGRITALAKGAGMIEPNMATMLCFVMTDLDISRESLRRVLPEAVEGSFNTITVDGDQSTSDMVLAFSSAGRGSVSEGEFAAALTTLLRDLAGDLVRNGEGTEHVIRLVVSGAPDARTAREAGKGVINSPLVKTAVAGNDPNVGRILSSLGDWAGNNGVNLDPDRVTLTMGGRILFQAGRFTLDQTTEDYLAAYLREARLPAESPGYPIHQRCVEIGLDLGMGSGTAEVLGSDLTHGYVTENADYRT
jgi:glutamate N-acetyltransferase/amino-acid N-acetyltransferase